MAGIGIGSKIHQIAQRQAIPPAMQAAKFHPEKYIKKPNANAVNGPNHRAFDFICNVSWFSWDSIGFEMNQRSFVGLNCRGIEVRLVGNGKRL